MKEIYKNDYGVSYLISNHDNKKYTLQLVINNLRIFMSLEEMKALLKIVRSSYKALENKCNCDKCKENALSCLWKVNNFFEVRLNIDYNILSLLEELIERTQFILSLDSVLEEHRIK